jgi:hypothetical protein
MIFSTAETAALEAWCNRAALFGMPRQISGSCCHRRNVLGAHADGARRIVQCAMREQSRDGR